MHSFKGFVRMMDVVSTLIILPHFNIQVVLAKIVFTLMFNVEVICLKCSTTVVRICVIK